MGKQTRKNRKKRVHGYFCPTCELRFIKRSIKNGLLPCGCNTKVRDAPFIQRFASSETRELVRLTYKAFRIENGHSNLETFFFKVRDKSMEIVQQPLLLKAVINARFFPTVYVVHWQDRCSKCIHWLQGSKPPGLPLLKKSKKCSKVDHCLMSCTAFELHRDYALKPIWGHPHK